MVFVKMTLAGMGCTIDLKRRVGEKWLKNEVYSNSHRQFDRIFKKRCKLVVANFV